MTSTTGSRDRELTIISVVYLCTSFVQMILAVWNLVTGDVNPFVLVAGSLALCVAAAANYGAHVRKTYRTCLESRGAEAATPYERQHYQNGVLGVRRPPVSSFFARAAWRAGRAVAASEAS